MDRTLFLAAVSGPVELALGGLPPAVSCVRVDVSGAGWP